MKGLLNLIYAHEIHFGHHDENNRVKDIHLNNS